MIRRRAHRDALRESSQEARAVQQRAADSLRKIELLALEAGLELARHPEPNVNYGRRSTDR